MNLSLIRSMTRSAVFELENGKCFRPEHPFAVALNGKTIYESCNTNVFSLFSLTPSTAYTVEVDTEGEHLKLDFTTETESFFVDASRYGLVAYGSSLDQIGPFTTDVTDCAIVLNAIAGHDKKDSTSIPMEKKDYTKALVNDVKGLKIGIPEEFFVEGLDDTCRKALEEAIETYRKLGAEIVPVKLPHMKYGLAAYYIIAPAEASSNLARYDGVGFGFRVDGTDIVDMYRKTRTAGFGPEVRRRIMLGTYVLSSGYYDAYYLRAMKVRTLLKQDFDKALSQCDVLLTPTAPDTAFRIGQHDNDPLAMYLGDVCTVSLNLAGLPGISIPCGYKDGMPIGMQLIGAALGEETLLRVAYTFEQNRTDLRKPLPMGEVEL